MKMRCRRVVLQCFGNGIRQMAARIHITCEDIRRSQTTFHTALESKQSTLDPVIFPEPLHIHHASDVQDHDHLREMRCHQIHHLLLCTCQVEITVLKEL